MDSLWWRIAACARNQASIILCVLGLWTLSSLVAVPSSYAVGRAYGMAGCGLGAVVMGADGNQILALTTNQTSYAPFAMTTGTSNCQEDPRMAALVRQQRYIAQNLDDLSKAIARGYGESLRGLADSLQCQPEAYADLVETLKNAYRQVFSAPGVPAITGNIRAQVQAHAQLSQSCSATEPFVG